VHRREIRMPRLPACNSSCWMRSVAGAATWWRRYQPSSCWGQKGENGIQREVRCLGCISADVEDLENLENAHWNMLGNSNNLYTFQATVKTHEECHAP
jgi:hypothetical protein